MTSSLGNSRSLDVVWELLESGTDPQAGACTPGGYDIIQALIPICQLSQQVLSVMHYARIVHQFSPDNRVNKASLTLSYVTIKGINHM